MPEESDYNAEGDYDPTCRCGHRQHWHTSVAGPCTSPQGCICRGFLLPEFRLDIETPVRPT